MRVFHRFCSGLLVFVGVVSTVRGGQTFVVQNGTGGVRSIQVRTFEGENCAGSAYVQYTLSNMQPGETRSNTINTADLSWELLVSGICADCKGHINPENSAIWSDCVTATNLYCVYHVVWTNRAETYALPRFVYDYGGGNLVVDSVAAYVKPGGVMNLWVTNAPVNGVCGALGVGDSVPGHDDTMTWFDGQEQYSVEPMPNGRGNDTGGREPVVDDPDVRGPGGGGTNGITQGDLFGAAAAIVQAVADVEKAVMINTATNTAGFQDLREGINGLGTNVLGMSSNVAAVAGILGAWTNSLASGLTNFALTNSSLASLGAYSNLVSGFMSSAGIGGMQAYTASFGTQLGYGFGQAVAEAFLDEDFLVITFMKPGLGGAPQVWYAWDLKPVISLQVIEDQFPGATAWFRLIVLWALVASCVLWLFGELREGLRDALTPPSDMSAGVLKYAAIGAPGGPIGMLTFGGGAAIYKGTVVLALVAGLLMLPSVCLATLQSIFVELQLTVNWMSNFSSVATGAPAVVYKVASLIDVWFPLLETIIVLANVAVAHLLLDSTVTVLMLYVKVAERPE